MRVCLTGRLPSYEYPCRRTTSLRRQLLESRDDVVAPREQSVERGSVDEITDCTFDRGPVERLDPVEERAVDLVQLIADLVRLRRRVCESERMIEHDEVPLCIDDRAA